MEKSQRIGAGSGSGSGGAPLRKSSRKAGSKKKGAPIGTKNEGHEEAELGSDGEHEKSSALNKSDSRKSHVSALGKSTAQLKD
jgi:hypothetical protein